MKVLIVSDTHGRHTGLDRVLEKEGKIDLFIHLPTFSCSLNSSIFITPFRNFQINDSGNYQNCTNDVFFQAVSYTHLLVST